MSAQPQSALADVGPCFADPVHAAQQTFRAVLEAMSRPGRVLELPANALRGLHGPGLSPGLTAVLLSLLDAEVELWLAPGVGLPSALGYLRFHTGVRPARQVEQAAFVVTTAAQATPDLWQRVHQGSDGAPQDGATLVVDVPSLEAGVASPWLRLSGPGIAGEHRLHVGGLDAAFWSARAALGSGFPRGVELILCCGRAIAALPRTTRIALES